MNTENIKEESQLNEDELKNAAVEVDKEATAEEAKEETTIETNENACGETNEKICEGEKEELDFETLYNEEKEKYNELYDKYLRALSEYDNYRKRTTKEKEMLYEICLADTVAKFLPVLDNLNRAVEAYKDNETIQSGLKMIAKQFEDILCALNVEKIEAVGCEFDPNYHDAVLHVEDDSKGANVIVEELSPGYKIGDRVIRHSMVKVAN
ncbi:MAG: nucleotide exchange factor GrpE [Clostridiaceae bacterium]|nr:nucleotide exchange factor GrpE [Clostridiaceae bacterium]